MQLPRGGGRQVVPVALQQIRYAAAEQFGLEVLVATERCRLQAAIIAGGAQRIVRVRVVISSLCYGGLWAAMRRRCHVNCVVESKGDVAEAERMS
jgi:hypothetical protein